jgi:hypothetical protein
MISNSMILLTVVFLAIIAAVVAYVVIDRRYGELDARLRKEEAEAPTQTVVYDTQPVLVGGWGLGRGWGWGGPRWRRRYY